NTPLPSSRYSTIRDVPPSPTRRSSDLEDMYYGWAEHIYKSPLYKIYMDDNGNFDESVIAIPNRIGWNDKVSVSDMVKQQVRQKTDRKSTRLNSSHVKISYAVFCLKKKK